MVEENTMKQTEIGLIPEDWEVAKVKDISVIKTGSKNTQDRIENGAYPFFVRSQTIERINSYSFDGEAVLTAGDGVGVGKVFHYVNEKFDLHQRVYLINNFRTDVSGFYFFKYFQNNFYGRIMQMTAKSSVDSVRMETISEMLIPLPPLAEQEAIATALSDCDTWIDSIEQVLAKKRLIKQGAMQELLTPKDDWEVKKLGDLTDIYTGKKNNQDKIDHGSFPFFVRSKNVERINSYSFDGEAILVPGEGNLGSIFHYINGKFDFHQRVYKVSDFEDIDGVFTYWYFQMYFGQHAMQNTVKATVDSIRLPTLLEFEICFPSLTEQTRIATILSDMDLEIEAIEQKLNKARQIKQGMMQELLTGRVRLV